MIISLLVPVFDSRGVMLNEFLGPVGILFAQFYPKMFGSWILLCTIASAAQTLVLLGDQYKQEDYSDFLTLLKDRGHNLVIMTDVKKVKLIEYEERMYDNVLSLSPLSFCFYY